MTRSPAVWLRLCAASIALLGVACASGTGGGNNKVYYATGKDAVTPDGLHRVRWEPFATTFVRPGANLSGYDAVILDEVTISYQRPPRKNIMPGTGNMTANFALSSEATEHMKRYFHEAFAKELSRSNDFRVVDAPGANVLRISGHIVGLVITTPPEKDQLVDETVYTSSAGAMTLLLDAKDSLTGEPLVRVGERQDITQADGIGQFYWSNPVSNAGAVRQLFDNWASRLRRELDQFKSLPEIPEA